MSSIYFSPSPDKNDAMQNAVCQAQETFRYFWRECYWESRRIVPGLDVSCVKVPFSDPPGTRGDDGGPEVEQMWLGEVFFDGLNVHGTLINSPNWLKSVREGDRVQTPLSGIMDWIYAIGGRAYGAWTVNCLRKGMNDKEREEHDAAWGLDFGDPERVEVHPGWTSPATAIELGEHPMAWNMSKQLEVHLQTHPADANTADEDGWTHLHSLSLAGSALSVSILLDFGADPNARTSSGLTSLAMADALGWSAVSDFLRSRGARE